jgi:3'-phosphoadenosine 5'-phosphosulfate (PAPS) 3'-phosphatase
MEGTVIESEPWRVIILLQEMPPSLVGVAAAAGAVDVVALDTAAIVVAVSMVSHACKRARDQARAHARTHTHTHTHTHTRTHTHTSRTHARTHTHPHTLHARAIMQPHKIGSAALRFCIKSCCL